MVDGDNACLFERSTARQRLLQVADQHMIEVE
jgi:hypothetical protein